MAMMLGEAQGRITLDVSDVMANSKAAQGALTGLDATAGKTGGGFETLKNGMLGLGTALIAPMALGLKGAVDLEQGIANINASLGGVDTSVLDELADMFLEVGSSSRYSATEVAAVSDELAKAGFTAEDMLGGMTAAVVELSQATGDGLVPATEGMIQAFSMWDESIVGVELAITDAAHAADVLTNASNQSAGGIQDIIGGLRNAGPALAAVGLSFEEAAGAIALFTNYGYSGDEIGTKLTRTLTFLAKPTEEAAAAMEQYGIAAFDAQGKFIGFPALFDQLQAGFEGVGEETRLAALKTIFGAEAFDLMNLAVETGGDPLREFTELMYESGTASEQSALRMNTLGAQFEELKEGVGAFLTSLVMGLVPGLRILVDTANTVIDVLSRIPGPIKTVIGAFAGLLAGIAAITRAMQAWQAIDMLLGGAGARRAGMFGLGAIGPIFIGLAAVIGTAAAAIKFNIFGLGDAFERFRTVWNNLSDSAANNVVSRTLISLGQALQTFDVGWLDSLGRGLNNVGRGINSFWDAWNGGASDAGSETEKVRKEFSGYARLLEDGVTWNVETQDGEKVGEIIESWDNMDGSTTVRIRTEGGEELETTIDMTTGFVETDYEVEVTVDKKSAKKSRSTIQKLQDGLDAMTATLEKSDMPWLAEFPRAASSALTMVDRLTGQFRTFRQTGMDPVESGLMAIGATFPRLRDQTAELYGTWNTLTGSFRDFRAQGLNPVESGILALGQTFPRLQTAMTGLYGVVDGLGDAFGAAIRGDWSAAFDGLAQAAQSAGVVIGEIAGTVADLAVDLFDWTINVGVPRIVGWLADNAGDIGGAIMAAAGWVWDEIIVPLGSLIVEIAGLIPRLAAGAVDIYESVKRWIYGRLGGTPAGDGTGGATGPGGGSQSIPIGAVAVLISDWIVESSSDLWERIKQWVLGTGAGSSGAGRAAGGGVASLAGTGIPIGPVAIQIREWDVVADAIDVYTAIDTWIRDSIEITDAEAARWEPTGQEIGRNIMRAILRGIGSAFGGGGGGGIGAGSGAAGVSTTSIITGTAFADSLWALLQPVLEGMWDELQPQLEAWGNSLKDQFKSWWNGFMPSIFEFDLGGAVGAGGAAAGGLNALAGGGGILGAFQDFLDGIMADLDALGAEIETAISEWWSGLWDFDLSIPDFDITSYLPDFGFSLSDIPGWDEAQATIAEVKAFLADPLGYVGGGDSGGGDALSAGASGVSAGIFYALQTKLYGGGSPKMLMGQINTDMLAIGNAISTGMAAVTTTIQAKGVEWGTAMSTAIAALNSGGAAGLGAAVGGGAAGVLSGLASSVAAGMTAVTSTIQTQSAQWGVAMAAASMNLGTSAAIAFAAVQTSAQTGMSNATAAVANGANQMSTALLGRLAGMQAGALVAWGAIANAAQSGGSRMAAAAAAAAATTAQVIQAGMAFATAAIRSAASTWPGIILAYAGAMRSAGFTVGQAAGQGVVAGLFSTLAMVQQAAAAIVQTAAGAMFAAGIIRSPSKLTAYVGEMMGMGLVVGMQSTLPMVSAASAAMMQMAQPFTPSTPASYGYGGTTVSAPVRVNAQIHTQGTLTDADKQALAREFAESLRDGIDIVYTSHGATS